MEKEYQGNISIKKENEESCGYATLNFYEVAAIEFLTGIKHDKISFADPNNRTFVYNYSSMDGFPTRDQLNSYKNFGKVMARQRAERIQIQKDLSKKEEINEAIDLLIKANEKKREFIEFNIPVGVDEVETIQAKIDCRDLDRIISASVESSKEFQQDKYEYYIKKGYTGPINQAEWDKERAKAISTLDADDPEYIEMVKRIDEQMPFNRADQMAKNANNLKQIRDLLAQYIRDDKNELMFPTEVEQKQFVELLETDIELMNLVVEQFNLLIKKVNEVNNQAKNSAKEKKAKSGSSKKPLPEDTMSILSTGDLLKT